MAKQKIMETEKPAPEGKSIRRFVFLPFRLAFQIFIAVLLFIYVVFGTGAVLTLYKRNIYQSQDVSSLEMDIDEATESGDSRTVAEWLRARPLAETDRLVDVITPKSAGLGANVFFEISRRQLALGRTEEALFWMELGRFRLLYDIIRCGAEPEAIDIFDPAFKNMHTSETDALLRAHPALLKKTAQRILDFDAKYPAHDKPEIICKAVLPPTQLPAAEINWEGYHQVLRQHTEEFLKSPDKAKATVKKK